MAGIVCTPCKLFLGCSLLSVSAPLSADHAGKRGFSEVEAIEHVRALTQISPQAIGYDALDNAIQVGFIRLD